MRRTLRQLLLKLSGNERFQRFLERNVEISQHLMGIGSGTSVDSSGEAAVVDLLLDRPAGSGSLCVFDVGANRGQFLDLVTGRLGGVPFHVHEFEPGASAFATLEARAGRDPRVTLNHVALGRERGERLLYYDEPGSGLASLSKRRLEHFGLDFGRSERIVVDTLDDYCLRRGVERIDLLKLDVEGHELDVLEGGRSTLADGRVAMISFEFGGCNIDSRTYFQDFYYFLRDHGMGALFRIAPSGYLAPIPSYRESHEQFRTTNFLAVRANARP